MTVELPSSWKLKICPEEAWSAFSLPVPTSSLLLVSYGRIYYKFLESVTEQLFHVSSES